jgi:hypothetical protein
LKFFIYEIFNFEISDFFKFCTVWTFGPLGFWTFWLWNAPAADGVDSGSSGFGGRDVSGGGDSQW